MNDKYESDGKECQLTNGVDVEMTTKTLKSLIASQGPDYLEKLFGPKAKNSMKQLGGVERVARALHGKCQFIILNIETLFSESSTIDDFGDQLNLNVEHLREVLYAVESKDFVTLKSFGIGVDMRFQCRSLITFNPRMSFLMTILERETIFGSILFWRSSSKLDFFNVMTQSNKQ